MKNSDRSASKPGKLHWILITDLIYLCKTLPHRRSFWPHRRRTGAVFWIASSTATKPFRPDVDESNIRTCAAEQLATHLARKKAEAVATNARKRSSSAQTSWPCSMTRYWESPAIIQKAIEQLLAASGKTVTFLTAVCVLDPIGARATNIPTRPPFDSGNLTGAWQKLTCATTNPTTVPAASNSRARVSSCLNP